MRRRNFLQTLGAASLIGVAPMIFGRRARAIPLATPPVVRAPPALSRGYENLLILIELKGGNDGLNTVVPYTDPLYAQFRPRLAIPRDRLLQLDDKMALHPSLAPLLPIWEGKELAVFGNVGYPEQNLSHFRSIEIWDTASRSDELSADGWLARTFRCVPPAVTFAAHGVVVGGSELGPLAGDGHAIAIADTKNFSRQAKLAKDQAVGGNAALAHILSVESEIVHAANSLGAPPAMKTTFPTGAFGNAIKTVAEVAASRPGVAVIRVSLSGFDTHHAQLDGHARVLDQLAQGMAALRNALIETNRWSSTLVQTYAEFGRRAHENESGGTDHGAASVHFAMGGRVVGGRYGGEPQLGDLDGNGNLVHRIDFRSLYSTVLDRWWQTPASRVLPGAPPRLDFLRA